MGAYVEVDNSSWQAADNLRAQVLAPAVTNSPAQITYFYFSQQGNPDPGYNIVGWNWTGTGFVGALSIISGATTSRASATCTLPGDQEATCVVNEEQQGGGGGQLTETITANCLTYGGPLTFTLFNNQVNCPTYSNDGGVSTAPYFLEYFGYDWVNYNQTDQAWEYSVPTNTQREQAVEVGLPEGQDHAVEITWYIPDLCDSLTLEEFETNPEWFATSPTSIDVCAAFGPFTGAVVSCAFNGTWADPATHIDYALSGIDDTETSGMINQVSGHMPKSVKVYTSGTYTPNSAYWPPGSGYAGSYYLMQLLDTNQNPFPGVLMQEVFTTSVPPGFQYNVLESWQTVLDTSPGGPHSDDGTFNAYDLLWLLWPPNVSWQTVSLTHDYLAATTDLSGVRGINVGPWNITYVPPGGASTFGDSSTYGTASQSGPSGGN